MFNNQASGIFSDINDLNKSYNPKFDAYISFMHSQNADKFIIDSDQKYETKLFEEYDNSKIQSDRVNEQINKNKEFTFTVKSRGKKIKKVNNCEHSDRQHYAKSMCRTCYSKYGRNKLPWNCQHTKLYAQGLCQMCYANKYNEIKRNNKEVSSTVQNESIELFNECLSIL